MLVLDHLLISAEQVSGGYFEPADPTAQDQDKAVASLTLFTPGGHIRVTDEAAVFLFDYLVQNHGTRIGGKIGQGASHVGISKEAIETLAKYFSMFPEAAPHTLLKSCKVITEHLAARI